jgi:hypothetical protein
VSSLWYLSWKNHLLWKKKKSHKLIHISKQKNWIKCSIKTDKYKMLHTTYSELQFHGYLPFFLDMNSSLYLALHYVTVRTDVQWTYTSNHIWIPNYVHQELSHSNLQAIVRSYIFCVNIQ